MSLLLLLLLLFLLLLLLLLLRLRLASVSCVVGGQRNPTASHGAPILNTPRQRFSVTCRKSR